jgi:hypothetical protein
MCATPTLEYDRFVRLAGLELCRYVDTLLNDPNTTVTTDTVERMLSDLSTYDEYHLVYALEIGAAHCPEKFALRLPQFLGHSNGSVCCAAVNALSRLPLDCITQELLDRVQAVPEQALFTEPINGSSAYLGTNSELVEQVLEELMKRMRQNA